MGKAIMFHEPLERYLLSKILEYAPGTVERVKIGRLSEPERGSNWDILEIHPSIPAAVAHRIEAKVVRPLRNDIDLAD
ncbi:hypothetical protein ACFPL7_00505 [Dongia soli]|uniref:Uncharacterized protein n=1 Tax=Dongia soli TaxID=600628 RepID=A0ABU5EEX7_9PROT|nr:hypothetical protein [Dongia soli]MDY0884409.1 hypothetical protein [Dongia soli]